MASNYATSETSCKCSDCLTADAEFWCDNCNNNYCSVCCTEVHKRRVFSNHRTTTIKEKSLKIIRCQIHDNQIIKYWCHICETLVCMDCVMLEHKNHKCALIETAAKEISIEVNIQLYVY